MNNVEQLRQYTLNTVIKIRQFASMLPGGGQTADLLRGDHGEERITRIVDFVMSELGHRPDYHGAEGAADGRSPTRRLVRKAVAKG